MFGDEDATGKSVMDDMREGKMTLLIRHALHNADTKQLKQLRTVYGNEFANREQHKLVCDLIIQLGSRDYVAHEAQKAARDALALLKAQTSWDNRGRQCLSDLVEFVVRRSS
jgi:geranylgeranyl diphosphate synthase type I